MVSSLRPLRYQRKAKIPTPVLIAVLLVAAGGAIYFGFFREREELLSDDPADATLFVCTRDGHVFPVTPRGFEDMFQRGDVRSDPHSGELLIRCPKCGQFTAQPQARQSPRAPRAGP